MWSAGLKVMNFQARTEPIRLFNILSHIIKYFQWYSIELAPHVFRNFINYCMLVSNFPSIVKDELAVLQQRTAVQKTAETRITYDTS